MKTRFTVTMVLLAGVTAASDVAGQTTPSASDVLLDVTLQGLGTLQPRASSPVFNGEELVAAGFVERFHQPEKSVDITLVKLEPSVSAWGDLVKFDVHMRNTGKRPLGIPWSSDPQLIGEQQSRPDSNLVGASVRLMVDAPDGSTMPIPISVQRLAGSKRDPGTLHVLAPGQVVTLRMFARWTTPFADEHAKLLKATQPQGAVRVRASLTLDGEGVNGESSNSVVATVLQGR